MIELTGCPFCGVLGESWSDEIGFVGCRNDGCLVRPRVLWGAWPSPSLEVQRRTEQQAADIWNTRADCRPLAGQPRETY
jgi:hypothetical protein